MDSGTRKQSVFQCRYGDERGGEGGRSNGGGCGESPHAPPSSSTCVGWLVLRADGRVCVPCAASRCPHAPETYCASRRAACKAPRRCAPRRRCAAAPRALTPTRLVSPQLPACPPARRLLPPPPALPAAPAPPGPAAAASGSLAAGWPYAWCQAPCAVDVRGPAQLASTADAPAPCVLRDRPLPCAQPKWEQAVRSVLRKDEHVVFGVLGMWVSATV